MSTPESIRFFDTGNRDLVDMPVSGRSIGIYTCGPTVYKDAHIGNMRAYMTADLLRRAIILNGGEPKQVINITDVGHLTSDADSGDDKVEKSASERGVTAWEIAKEYEKNFWEDYDALSMQRPEVIAHATEHIDEQIALIQDLEKAGVTYQTGDGIYFDSTKFSDYAKFANLDLGGISAGSRVDIGNKIHPTDFALWKFPQGQGRRDMQWNSPWGEGFPGWHIECSAMAIHHLGPQFDIHTGGIDHIPVHHTNEIAQAKAAGYNFANHWLHTAFLLDESGEKMSKSSGASSRLPTVLLDYKVSADALRYMYMTHHYQGSMEFSEDKLQQAASAHSRMLDNASTIYQAAKEQPKDHETNDRSLDEANKLWLSFTSALTQDNLNSPVSIDVLHKTMKSKMLSPDQRHALIDKMDDTLSLGIKRSISNIAISSLQQELLNKRDLARKAKDFATSDFIRDKLFEEHSLKVIDSPAGQVVRRR